MLWFLSLLTLIMHDSYCTVQAIDGVVVPCFSDAIIISSERFSYPAFQADAMCLAGQSALLQQLLQRRVLALHSQVHCFSRCAACKRLIDEQAILLQAVVARTNSEPYKCEIVLYTLSTLLRNRSHVPLHRHVVVRCIEL
jgi:hypothetical protein